MLHVEETRRATQLLQVRLTERLLDDNVQQVLTHRVLLVNEVFGEKDLLARFTVNFDDALLALETGLELERLVNFGERVDGLARDDELPEGLLEGGALRANNCVHLVRLPELGGTNFEGILKHAHILSQRETVLVREQINLLHFAG